MPHQCTECGRTFPDGSKEMLSGCPDCGGNKFQFDPAGDADEPDADDGDASPEPPDRGGVADRVGRATATVRRWVSGRDGGAPAPEDDTSSPTERPSASSGDGAPPNPRDGGQRPDSPTAATDASSSDAADAAVADSDDGRGYGEWPNPDGVDTGGVGKGPEARRNRSSSDEAAREWPDATDHSDRPAGDPDDRPRTDADDSSPTETDDRPPTDVDDPSPIDGESEEDSAQASARSDVVSRDELPESPPDSGTLGPRRRVGSGNGSGVGTGVSPTERPDDAVDTDAVPGGATGDPAESEAPPETGDGRVASEPSTEDQPDLEDLREELNDQFESIKIVEPGQYELNLMELYDREEYIISLQEDGRYVIEVPERWRDED